MAIEVYNVVLKPDTIIGVGPLVRTVKADPISVAQKQLRLQFDLYLYNYRITITTDELSFSGPDKSTSDAEALRIRKAWEQIRENLANERPMQTGFPDIAGEAATMPV